MADSLLLLYSLHYSTLFDIFATSCIIFITIMPFSTHTKILKEVGTIYYQTISLEPSSYEDSLMSCMPKWWARTVCVCLCVCLCTCTCARVKLALRIEGLTETWPLQSLLSSRLEVRLHERRSEFECLKAKPRSGHAL